MTIKEYAESKKVSRQRVYQMIVKAGKQTSDFTDKEGQLTKAGIADLDELFKQKDGKQSKVNIQQKLLTLTTENIDLKKENERLSNQVNTLTETVDRLTRTLEKQTENLNNEQQLHGRDLLRLEQESRTGQGQREPLFKRLFGKKQKGDQET